MTKRWVDRRKNKLNILVGPKEKGRVDIKTRVCSKRIHMSFLGDIKSSLNVLRPHLQTGFNRERQKKPPVRPSILQWCEYDILRKNAASARSSFSNCWGTYINTTFNVDAAQTNDPETIQTHNKAVTGSQEEEGEQQRKELR